MTRTDVTSGMQEQLGEQSVTVLPIVELDFDGDPVHAWGGIGDLSWDGKVWTGVGNMGEIGSIQASAKGVIPSLELSLLGIEPNMLTVATQEKYRGRNGRVWLACFLENMEMADTPALYFAGEISTMSLVDGQDRRIRVVIDSRMALLKQSKPRYRTDEDQQRRHPGDLFFNFTPAVVNKTIYWGLKAPSRTSSSGSGAGYGEWLGPGGPRFKV